jgi:bifunctional non-homologous end joining protein LigD
VGQDWTGVDTGLAWVVNLGCFEVHPNPVRSSDLDHPDELRVDLDPGPGVSWTDVRSVALEVQYVLDEMGLRGWPKTSGSRGILFVRGNNLNSVSGHNLG